MRQNMGKFPNFQQAKSLRSRAKSSKNGGFPCFSKIGTASAMLGMKPLYRQAAPLEGQVQGVLKMEKNSNSVREIGQLMSVAIAAVLFGSTMILSAVGPARASEAPVLATQDTPATLRYLA